jgi:CubicO group peptidase (beta-lactamase class C family)
MWGIASNSKLFVALSIGLLVDRKTSIPGAAGAVLDYGTKLKAVLPWWGVMDAYAEQHLTVLDMLGQYRLAACVL